MLLAACGEISRRSKPLAGARQGAGEAQKTSSRMGQRQQQQQQKQEQQHFLFSHSTAL
jgi:hypothetical protein